MCDHHHMKAALGLARRGLGQCWPNPSVGCVIEKDGVVVGRATTAAGGRPHAEAQALAMAGAAARGGTAYVTLEPCSHYGRTPPCADALIKAGIARVVVAICDPDPRVSGRGIARLRDAGVIVEQGLMAAQAEALAEGFIRRVKSGRPMITLKLASTLDGRIATRSGESQWISSAEARRAAHALRGQHDAVMVGVGTVLADNPDLTCRIDGYKRVPNVRIVADSHLRTGLLTRLVGTAAQSPVWMLAREDADPKRRAAMSHAGVQVIGVKPASIGIDLLEAVTALGAKGLTRVLVEGGASLAASLLRADLVDHLAWFHAPCVMGADGWPAAQAFGISKLAAMPKFERVATSAVGPDILTHYRRLNASS